MLVTEKQRVRLIMLTFCSSFMVLCLTHLLRGFYHHQCVTVMMAYPQLFELLSMAVFFATEMLPIGLLMFYHHLNFRTIAVQEVVVPQRPNNQRQTFNRIDPELLVSDSSSEPSETTGSSPEESQSDDRSSMTRCA